MGSDPGSHAIPVGHRSKLNLTSYQLGTDGNRVWDHISGAQMDFGFGTISMGALAEIVIRNGAGKRLSRRTETY